MDVKWIKLSTALPSNRKVKAIRTLPEGDSILVLWIYLLLLAGEINDCGMIYFTPDIAYTEEMLASQFDMDVNIIRLGLSTFEKFGMIEIVDDVIQLTGWEKYQSLDKMEKIKEQTRKRVAKYRDNKRLSGCNVTSNANVTQCNATDIDIEIDIDKNKSKNSIIRHKYGEYTNVLLSDEEFSKLRTEFPIDWSNRIERLSEYIASTGKKYKSHLATIRAWAKKESHKESKGYDDIF